jgi:hypothetical protein
MFLSSMFFSWCFLLGESERCSLTLAFVVASTFCYIAFYAEISSFGLVTNASFGSVLFTATVLPLIFLFSGLLLTYLLSFLYSLAFLVSNNCF